MASAFSLTSFTSLSSYTLKIESQVYQDTRREEEQVGNELPALEVGPPVDFDDLLAAQPRDPGPAIETTQTPSIVQSQSSGLEEKVDFDYLASVVESLMLYRLEGETKEFSMKAIDSLVWKLNSEQLELLVTAVIFDGAKPSICITIPRTINGRLQIADRKVFPHVIYAKIWRWLDVNKCSDLKHLQFCQYPYDLKLEVVCVNPYHYERIVSQGLSSSDIISPNVVHHTSLLNQESMEDAQSHSGCGGCLDVMTDAAIQQQEYMEIELSHAQALSGGLGRWGLLGASPYNSALQMNQPLQYYNPVSYAPPVPQAVAPAPPTSNFVTNNSSPLPRTKTPDFWCVMSYYELKVPVHESFKVPAGLTSVIVDGFVDPSRDDKFCLGRYSNLHRTEASKIVRLHIEKGIIIEEKNETEVWIKCLSNHSVFVQSCYLDYEAGQAQGSAVHKIFPDAYVKVFDLFHSYEEMQKQARKACLAVANQAAAVRGGSLSTARIDPNPARNIGADELRPLCILRLSFVKGWGSNYKRQTIKETPCWIEVNFNRAFQLLDSILIQLPSESQIQDLVKLQ